MVEVNFTLEERNFTSAPGLFLMPEESIQSMGEAIDKFMGIFLDEPGSSPSGRHSSLTG